MPRVIMYDHIALFLRVIMSSLRAMCWLLSVKKQTHNFHCIYRIMYINKTLDLVFVNLE